MTCNRESMIMQYVRTWLKADVSDEELRERLETLTSSTLAEVPSTQMSYPLIAWDIVNDRKVLVISDAWQVKPSLNGFVMCFVVVEEKPMVIALEMDRLIPVAEQPKFEFDAFGIRALVSAEPEDDGLEPGVNDDGLSIERAVDLELTPTMVRAEDEEEETGV